MLAVALWTVMLDAMYVCGGTLELVRAKCFIFNKRSCGHLRQQVEIRSRTELFSRFAGLVPAFQPEVLIPNYKLFVVDCRHCTVRIF